MKLDQTRLLEIISGQRTGLSAAIIRRFLFGLSLVYRFAIRIRNWAYDSGWKTIHRFELPVISIGNLTAGGTGKTPFVIWLASRLANEHNVAIVSRGYRSIDEELNDEGREIEQRLPDIKQIQNADRIFAVRQLVEELARDAQAENPVVILDDGFQHRRLGRELDIVLVDATCPFGFDFMLPRGLLREPVNSIKRSQLAVLTRSNLVEAGDVNKIKRRLVNLNPDLKWAEGELQVGGWISIDRARHPIGFLQDKRLFAFCGIGNPNSFIQTLQRSNCEVVEKIFFDDHHKYCVDDIVHVADMAKQNQCDAIVCTHKDLVKLDFQIPDQTPVLALLAEFRVAAGEDVIDAAVRNALAKLKDSR